MSKQIPAERLTKEYLENYAKEQIEIYLSTNPSNETLAWAEIKEAYKVARLPEPKNIVWYDSPKQFTDSVRDSVRDSVWDSVRASVRDSVRDSVWASVWALTEAGYNAWLKYFNDNQELNDFRHICLFSEQVTGYLLTADTVHAVRKPKRLVRGSMGRLHYDHGKAIEWHDGYGFYYLHGVEFDEEIYNKIINEQFTAEDLVKGNLNAQQRPVAIQMMRPDRMIKEMNATLIDTGKHDRTKLYEVKDYMGTKSTEYFIFMEHPTIKGKHYIEWVEPSVAQNRDADLAQAVAFQMTKRQYLNSINK